MIRSNNQAAVARASLAFRGSCGESEVACRHAFVPAFRNSRDGCVEIAKLADGNPAAMHLISHLPGEWAARCDAQGNVLELIAGIEAGFVRDGQFYSRAEAAAAG